MKTLFLAWQDPKTREWTPIGRLSYDGEYTFVYTKGANKSATFSPFSNMSNISILYKSSELFPFFSNRLLQKNRPEYSKYITWLNLENSNDIEFEMLALTEGRRETDNYELFPCPTPTPDNKYELRFFCHGMRHMSDETIARVARLPKGEPLLMMMDFQNRFDPRAIALRTCDPPVIVGYVPRYLVHDFTNLLRSIKHTPSQLISPSITLHQTNPDAPIQFRMLCQISYPWPQDFKPCSGELFEPIASSS
ncbi:hypothetical protein NNJEOMEG_02841 [Fundidesulfovibrio magnetotacticus]|uniref:HIRAN domain-containing protein n=1 Tax=Fundidesulfovibrio magnetotacticus TaxID=2730080 RepID=A0A6V8LR79_9BACT|nr:HIRAN domain-containing protein [Fundidesulfovibrio magnetotacticus]GFK94993.1 hypothetical protein NNJEOMEG_02841 [Fundidesulfovibrio magnetotacticus]